MNHSSTSGLYVHVPFCRGKCPYCDFYSVTDLSLVDGWLSAVLMEARLYKPLFARFDSLYIGGGTPTVLDHRRLSLLMAGLRHELDFTSDAEVTIEANPDDIDPERISLLLDLGINRVSLGVQSLDSAELLFLRRRHDARQTMRALELVRGSGIGNVSVDLIYGIEGQTLGRWLATLHRVLEIEPEHLSCYQMTIEEGTVFGDMRAEGRIKPLGEDEGADFYLNTSRTLEARGYLHYEISSFARGQRYISRHNSKYWHHAPYLGLGPAAHSFRPNKRWWNVRSVREYCRCLGIGGSAVEGSEMLTPEQITLERLFLGLRTKDGVDLTSTASDLGGTAVVTALENEGVVRICGSRLVPTLKGFLLADSLPLLLSL